MSKSAMFEQYSKILF